MPRIIFSLAFFALLESAVFLPDSYFWFFALGAIALSSYVLLGASLERVKKYAFLILAVLLVLPAFLLLGISQSFIFTQMIILIASLIFYAMASGYLARHKSAVALVSFAEFLAIVFLVLAYQTTSAASGWVVGPIIFVAVFLLFFSSLYLSAAFRGALLIRLLYFSLLTGFITTELYLVLARLPFNLPSIDFLIFIIYYGIWDVSLRYFTQRLTKKILLFDVLFIALSYAAVFLSAKWFPN